VGGLLFLLYILFYTKIDVCQGMPVFTKRQGKGMKRHSRPEGGKSGMDFAEAAATQYT
jgi:hypothetical protein